jgi:hypothetical protein
MKNLKIGLLLAFFVLSACAAMTKIHISNGDLPGLKGEWEGMRDIIYGNMRFHDFAEMEVFNDTLPLRGKVIIYFLAGTDTRIYPFEKGVIDSEGRLVLPLDGQTEVVLSLYRGEKGMKLWGSYFYLGREGTLSLTRK